jgi:hypothetical protein
MVHRDWRICIHEAGHATVARLLRLPCGEASVAPHAYARVAIDDHGAASIIAMMAGAASEVELLGDYDAIGVQVDAARVAQRVKRYGLDADALWDLALGMVRQQRPVIARLAVKLRRAGMLDVRTIDGMVRRWQWRG